LYLNEHSSKDKPIALHDTELSPGCHLGTTTIPY